MIRCKLSLVARRKRIEIPPLLGKRRSIKPSLSRCSKYLITWSDVPVNLTVESTNYFNVTQDSSSFSRNLNGNASDEILPKMDGVYLYTNEASCVKEADVHGR